MAKVQKAIRVENVRTIAELNEFLEGGWKVINMCEMPSSVHSTQSASLVIIEGEI